MRLRAAVHLPLAGPAAGALGGGAVGILDGTVAALIGSTPAGGDLGLPLLGAGLGALAGALLASLLGLLSAAVFRLGRPGRVGLADRVAVVALALPLIAYDSLALFGGPRAARIPGRPLLSVVLFLGGLALTWWLAGRFSDLTRQIDLRGRSGARGAGVALLLAALVATIYPVNRLVLPHLYSWFHATLSLAILVGAVLAARLLVVHPGPALRTLLTGMVVALLSAGGGLVLVRASQARLFTAHERTLLICHGLRVIPVRPPRQTRPAGQLLATGAGDGDALPEGPHRRDADVLLITVDALRADHVGAYGYTRPTTPNIDGLARRGVRFERAYAQAPHTSYSVTSMLTGRYYPTLARLDPGSSEDALAFHLRRYGWKTAAFYPPAVFYVGADKLRPFEANHFEFEYFKVEYLDAHARMSQIAEFFARDRPARVFLWIHFFEPHESYERWADHDFGPRDIDRYDSEIAYTDAAIGRLIAYFDRERPGAIIILTADHGEAFGEHGGHYHGTSLYEEQIRVPLIIAVPDSPAQVVAGPVELVDVAPTVLGLLDIPIPVRMRGTDLGPWLRSPPAPASRLGKAFAEFEDTRMVVGLEDKLICQTQRGFCEYFDLRADPGERRNLVDENPARVAALRAELEGWFEDQSRFALSSRGRGAGPPALERARLGDPTAVGPVAALLTANQPAPVREEAARLLATALPAAPETREPLKTGLADGERGVREWATVALARLGDPAALAGLLPIVSSPQASALRLQAARVLAERGDRAAVPALTQELPLCGEVAVCRPIVQAMGKLRDRRATEPLIAHLAQVSDRPDTVVALGEIGDPAALPALAERLSVDEYVTVRAAAAEALGKIGEGGGLTRRALTQALVREKETVVLAAVQAALERLKPGSSSPGSSAGRPRSPRSARPR